MCGVRDDLGDQILADLDGRTIRSQWDIGIEGISNEQLSAPRSADRDAWVLANQDSVLELSESQRCLGVDACSAACLSSERGRNLPEGHCGRGPTAFTTDLTWKTASDPVA
jgi:hypothetical protein